MQGLFAGWNGCQCGLTGMIHLMYFIKNLGKRKCVLLYLSVEWNTLCSCDLVKNAKIIKVKRFLKDVGHRSSNKDF